MIEALKEILTSKKFWMTVIGSGICGGLAYVHAPNEIIAIIGGIFGTYNVGQGIADSAKSSK